MRPASLVVFFCLAILQIFGYSGAPGSCDVPDPNLMSVMQSSTAPFVVSGFPSTYQTSAPYNINVTNAGGMKGFLIHFTDAAGRRWGSFSNFPSKLTSPIPACGTANDALGHNINLQACAVGFGCGSTSVSFTWTAPSSPQGTLKMSVVVVQSISTWWRTQTDIPAAQVIVPPAPAPAPSGVVANPNSSCIRDCSDYCQRMSTTCSKQFNDFGATCQQYCASYPCDVETAVSGDSYSCRIYHLGVAEALTQQGSLNLARWHCSHAGPTGGDACGASCSTFCRYEALFCPTTYGQCATICPDYPRVTTPETTRTSSSVEFNVGITTGDSLECRHYHLMVASQGGGAATTHCPHTAPDGGNGVCGSLCEGYCDLMAGACPTQYAAFGSRANCLTACSAYDMSGPVGATSGDTAQCRIYHAGVATVDNTHCPHATPVSTDGAGGPGPCANPCKDYCNLMAATCNSTVSTLGQYPSFESCLADCAVTKAGKVGDLSGDSLGCRVYHVGVANQSLASNSIPTAIAHCTHAGPSGGAVCGTPCEAYCNRFMSICNTAVTAYAYTDMSGCMAYCLRMNQSDVNPGPYSSSITTGNTLGCRIYHIDVAAADSNGPAFHCSHASWPSANGACGTEAEQYCQYMSTQCPSTFSSDFPGGKTECLAWANSLLTSLPGTSTDTAGNSFACRKYHLGVAVLLSSTVGYGLDNVHCVHASKSGGNVCSSLCQDYCAGIASNCTGTKVQYTSTQACLNTCQQTNITGPAFSDSMSCRIAELTSPNPRCEVAGPAGGNSSVAGAGCGGICLNYCSRIMQTCTGTNLQFKDFDTCMKICPDLTVDSIPFAASGSVIGANGGPYMQCRLYHLSVATIDPNTHCVHAGLTGGGVCGSLTDSFCALYPKYCPVAAAADLGVVPCSDVFLAPGTFALGSIGDTSGNSLSCRMYHVGVAASIGTLNNVHCSHASANGGGVCVAPPDCTKYCSDVKTKCGGTTAVTYDPICASWCSNLTKGAIGDTSGNSVGCRQRALAVSPSACQEAGYSGGGVCGDYCQNYCSEIMATCIGANAQYESAAACVARCAAFNSTGNFDISVTSGATLACRSYHLQVAKTNAAAADVHCPHAGPTGGSVCGTECDAYCDYMQFACTTYASRAACMTACATLPTTGVFGDTTGNSLQCRFYHVGVAIVSTGADRTAHCTHASQQSIAGICAAAAVPVACPAAAPVQTYLVDIAAKVNWNATQGYPSAFTINGVSQARVCVPTGTCAIFQVNTPDCFHPFYLTATSTSNGGQGIGEAITSATGLASTNNFACAGSSLSYYSTAPTTLAYQCTIHLKMGAMVDVNSNCAAATSVTTGGSVTTDTNVATTAPTGTATTATSNTNTNGGGSTTTATGTTSTGTDTTATTGTSTSSSPPANPAPAMRLFF